MAEGRAREHHCRYVCLMGPTAVGKTALAVQLRRMHAVELVSVDSAMVYRGLDIGSGKPDAETLVEAPHRLIDIRDPGDVYSAGDFAEDARTAIHDITDSGNLPLLVGGTGLYFRALREGLSPLPRANAAVRAKLQAEADIAGWDRLHARLSFIDPAAGKRIHPSDRQRIQRALEVHALTGMTLTALQEQSHGNAGWNDAVLMLVMVPLDRQALHDAIARRFDEMLELGLVDEVATLRDREDLHRDLPAMRAVGYRQVWDYLEGTLSYLEMRDKAIAATRQLARRQLTWLRSLPGATSVEIDVARSSDTAVQRALARDTERHIRRWLG